MEGRLNKITNSKSRAFLSFCFCFIAGVAVFSGAERVGNLTFCLFIVLFVPLLMLILFWRERTYRFAAFCLLFFLLGAARFVWSIPRDSPNNLSHYNGQKATVKGWVSAEPDVRMNKARYIIKAEEISYENLPFRKVKGKMLFELPLHPRYEYGEGLNLSCSLEEPTAGILSEFDYKRYLARYGVWSVCKGVKHLSSRAKAEYLTGAEGYLKSFERGSSTTSLLDFGRNDNRGFWFMSFILFLKSKVNQQIERLWPEPESSFMAGLLYGSRSGLPQELVDNFSRTGITHIIAVSGFNVSIITVSLMSIVIYLGLSRRRAFWLTVGGIILFVIFTGASASVVRAGIMASIVLIAQYIGRFSSVGRVLALAVVAMLLLNPFVLVWDAGFQLSFLATLGLVYLSPVISGMGKGVSTSRRDASMSAISEIFIYTLSAIIVTLPLILYQFGRLSIVAPIVNVLILWIIPWLMLFGFLSVALSFIFFPLGQVVAWVSGIGLNYVIMTVNWFGEKKWAAVEMSLPWWGMWIAYATIVFIIVRRRSDKTQSSL